MTPDALRMRRYRASRRGKVAYTAYQRAIGRLKSIHLEEFYQLVREERKRLERP